MPADKPKKYCSVLIYLKHNNPNLHQAIEDFCLFGSFGSRDGMTFLLPDKTYINKLVADAYNGSKSDKFIHMIKSLIITSDISKNSIQNSVVNRNGKAVNVTNENNKLTYSGIVITPLDAYNNSKTAGNTKTSIYSISIKKDKKITEKDIEEKSTTKTGGSNVNKAAIAAKVETHYKTNNNAYVIAVGLICKLCENKQEIYSGLCASYKASFYNLLNPYGNENPYKITDPQVNEISKALEDLSMSGTNEEDACKVSIDALIDECRVNASDMRKISMPRQKQILTDSKCIADFKTCVETEYVNKQQDLYKDLLTIYCYIATVTDGNGSTDYFKHCFLPAVKNFVNDGKGFSESTNDLANLYSMYGNLLKSDAFLYVPIKSTENAFITNNYAPTDYILPKPENNDLFTIQFNETMIKRGGGEDNSIMHALNN
jgi:hypothetical protein